MAVPPPADPPGPQPPGSPSPIDRALLSGVRRPAGPPRPRPTPVDRTTQPPRAESPPVKIDLPGHGLRFRPVVHVEDMAASVAFYQGLGAEIVHGGPDGDWVLIQLGTTQIDLITRPPRADRGECTVELNFAAEEPLKQLRDRLGRAGGLGDTEAEVVIHPDLGELLEVRTPDGLLIKISQIDPDL